MENKLNMDLLDAFLEPYIDNLVDESVKRYFKKYTEELDLKSKPEKPVSLKEIAKTLDYSISHLYKMSSKDEIPYHKLPSGKLAFYWSEVNEWVRNRRKE